MNLREKRAKAKAAALAVEVCFQGGCPFLFGAWREEVEGLAGLLSKPDLIFCKCLLRGLFPQGGGWTWPWKALAVYLFRKSAMSCLASAAGTLNVHVKQETASPAQPCSFDEALSGICLGTNGS